MRASPAGHTAARAQESRLASPRAADSREVIAFEMSCVAGSRALLIMVAVGVESLQQCMIGVYIPGRQLESRMCTN